MSVLYVGLAVGDIPPLMKQATDHRNKLFFELVADCEIFRYQIAWFFCRHKLNDAIAYSYRDLNDKKWYKQLKRWILKCIMRDDEGDQSEQIVEEQLTQHTIMLKELSNQVHVVVEQTKTETKSTNGDINKKSSAQSRWD